MSNLAIIEPNDNENQNSLATVQPSEKGMVKNKGGRPKKRVDEPISIPLIPVEFLESAPDYTAIDQSFQSSVLALVEEQKYFLEQKEAIDSFKVDLLLQRYDLSMEGTIEEKIQRLKDAHAEFSKTNQEKEAEAKNIRMKTKSLMQEVLEKGVRGIDLSQYSA